jgi:ankyrin repeat protein
MELHEPTTNPTIWAAAKEGRTEDALRLVADGADVLETNWAGVSALHYAAGGGDRVVVTLLLEKGADVNGKTLSGFSPLHDSAAGGHAATVKILLDKGAHVNVKTADGTTPLHASVEGGHDAVVKLLLDKGADVHVKTADEEDTPLHLAVEAGHCTTVQMLLGNGADLNARNSSGETPEDLASAEGQEEVLSVLRAEATRRARWTAFAMAQHSRLGAGAQLVRGIESEVLRMILDRS